MENNTMQNVAKSEAPEGLKQETKVQIFSNNEFGQVRTTLNENGEPLFCLSDVCKVLELDSSQVQKRLDDGVFTIHPILDSLNRVQNANFVNEDGLYDVILDSRKPSAKKFRKWITSEILPSIRKTGSYNIQQQLPQNYLSALKALVKSEEEKQQLALENNVLAEENRELEQEKNMANQKVSIALDYIKEVNPKARAWSKLADTDGLFSISQFASKIGFTPQKINAYLTDKGIITKDHKKPTYKFLNKGYFGVREMVINTIYGEKKITQLMVTSLGEEYIVEQLYKDNLLDINQTVKQMSLKLF